jgi:hypothetical protein
MRVNICVSGGKSLLLLVFPSGESGEGRVREPGEENQCGFREAPSLVAALQRERLHTMLCCRARTYETIKCGLAPLKSMGTYCYKYYFQHCSPASSIFYCESGFLYIGHTRIPLSPPLCIPALLPHALALPPWVSNVMRRSWTGFWGQGNETLEPQFQPPKC